MPTVEHVGVSRKITEEEERRRLKTVLKEIREERGGGGLIARTAGQAKSPEAFLRDGAYLSRTWDEVRAVRRAHPQDNFRSVLADFTWRTLVFEPRTLPGLFLPHADGLQRKGPVRENDFVGAPQETLVGDPLPPVMDVERPFPAAVDAHQPHPLVDIA